MQAPKFNTNSAAVKTLFSAKAPKDAFYGDVKRAIDHLKENTNVSKDDYWKVRYMLYPTGLFEGSSSPERSAHGARPRERGAAYPFWLAMMQVEHVPIVKR